MIDPSFVDSYIYDGKEEGEGHTEPVSQDMKEFLSSRRLDSVDIYQQRQEENGTSYVGTTFLSNSKPSNCDDIPSSAIKDSFPNASNATNERRKTVTFLDNFESDDEEIFKSSEYIIPERSSNNAFASAMNRRASVLGD